MGSRLPLGREDAVILVVRIDGRAKIKKSAVYRKQVNNEKKGILGRGDAATMHVV